MNNAKISDLADIPAREVLFFMACSDRKNEAAGELPLAMLYDGPTWQTFRAYRPAAVQDSAVIILSGKFGWTCAMASSKPYNERISAQKVDRLIERGATIQERNNKGLIMGMTPAQLASRPYGRDPWRAVVVCGGAEYRRAFFPIIAELQQLDMIDANAKILVTEGGIGEQRGQLGEILRALGGDQAPAEDLTPEGIQLVIPGAERMQPPSRAQLELF
jgi:hypothetical protein